MGTYLDASAIIYALEGVAPFQVTVIARMAQAEASHNGLLLTSRLSRLECRIKPLRDGDAALLAVYDRFFTRRMLYVIDITASIIERATDLRVRYNVKTPDAIHLATAIEASADRLLTGDAALARVREVPVEVL